MRILPYVVLAFLLPPVMAAPASREYKLILDSGALKSEQAADIAAKVERTLQNLAGEKLSMVSRGKTVRDKSRTVRFIDTPGDCLLRQAGLIVRDRGDEKKRAVTLKLRGRGSEDWARHWQLKEEEDVTPPLQVTSSRSLSSKIPVATPLKTVADLLEYFPALAGLKLPTGKAVQSILQEDIREETFTLPQFKLGGRWSETELSIWYFGRETQPGLIEVSFRYEVDPADDAVTRALAERWFTLWQGASGLPVRGAETTKTAHVFRRAAGFCQVNP